MSNVARESQIERKVVEGCFGILEDILLAYRVPVFTRRAKLAVASHPKFYFFDVGLFNVYRGKERLLRDGISFEPASEFLLGNAPYTLIFKPSFKEYLLFIDLVKLYC